MLSRFANVSADGKYSKPPHDKLSYGGVSDTFVETEMRLIWDTLKMIYIRAQMISSLAWQLAKGKKSCAIVREAME